VRIRKNNPRASHRNIKNRLHKGANASAPNRQSTDHGVGAERLLRGIPKTTIGFLQECITLSVHFSVCTTATIVATSGFDSRNIMFFPF
jgi:hypothetical protein